MSAEVVLIEKQLEVAILHKKKKILLDVTVIDGHLIGNFSNGIRTSYIDYFNKNSENVRKKHFKQIKKYVESHQKKLISNPK